MLGAYKWHLLSDLGSEGKGGVPRKEENDDRSVKRT